MANFLTMKQSEVSIIYRKGGATPLPSWNEAFCEQLRCSEEQRPGFPRHLARLIPIDRTFTFQVEHLKAELE